ncbi:MAG TPA: SxtJ family membrane protein [Pirellulales bacterium]|nr:SxtJ family membrane protein [Pirellulales bacterium]
MNDINFHPSTRTLRQFAALLALFLLAISRWQYAIHGRPMAALALASAAILAGALGIVAPAALRWLFVGLTLATYPIGWLMSWLLLGALYYLVFTPIALGFRLARRDPLERDYNEAVETYWTEKPSVNDVRRYFRQF